MNRFLLFLVLCSAFLTFAAAKPRSAPPFSLWTVDRQLNTLSGLLNGQRFVVLSFFATWCAPCRSELPMLVKLNEQHQARGVKVVVVSVDEDKVKLEAFLAEQKPQLLFLSDPYAVAAKAYGLVMDGLVKVPRTFLIDGAGTILAEFSAEPDLMSKLATLMEEKKITARREKK